MTKLFFLFLKAALSFAVVFYFDKPGTGNASGKEFHCLRPLCAWFQCRSVLYQSGFILVIPLYCQDLIAFIGMEKVINSD